MAHFRPEARQRPRQVSEAHGPLWALRWTPWRCGGLGTNPEYALKSTDKFLTSLSTIQLRIRDQRKVPLLKFWVRRSSLRSLPQEAEANLVDWVWPATGNEEEGGEVGLVGAPPVAAQAETEEIRRRAGGCKKGSEQTRNVPSNQIDSILTSPLWISDLTHRTRAPACSAGVDPCTPR
jgi:hypothetical protein